MVSTRHQSEVSAESGMFCVIVSTGITAFIELPSQTTCRVFTRSPGIHPTKNCNREICNHIRRNCTSSFASCAERASRLSGVEPPVVWNTVPAQEDFQKSSSNSRRPPDGHCVHNGSTDRQCGGRLDLQVRLGSEAVDHPVDLCPRNAVHSTWTHSAMTSQTSSLLK